MTEPEEVPSGAAIGLVIALLAFLWLLRWVIKESQP